MAYTVSRDNMKRAIRKIRQVERNEPANPSIRDDFEISEDYRSIIETKWPRRIHWFFGL